MHIGKIELTEDKVATLVSEIRRKKELGGLSNSFVKEVLLEAFSQQYKLFCALANDFNPKSKAYAQIIKEVRAKLRRRYGLFRVDMPINELEPLVTKLLDSKKQNRKALLTMILSTHSSTKERLTFYAQLYPQIFNITGKPSSIIDLGCGINPFSAPLMKLRKLKYYAYDLSEKEKRLLNLFFKLMNSENHSFWGEAEVMDFSKINLVSQLNPADVAFLFKITEVLEQGKGHKVSEMLIKDIPAKFIVVSFPTRTMSRRRMNHPRRKWIELMCDRLNFKFKVLEFSNEIFYVITK